MDFGFAQGAGYAEDHSFSVFTADADGDQGGAISDGAVDADFVVGGVESEVGDRWKGAFAPFIELDIELGGEL